MKKNVSYNWVSFSLVFLFLLAVSGFMASETRSSTEQFFFTKNLKRGDRSEEVKQLQQYLNKQGIEVAKNGPGAPGNETNYFGAKTQNAVARFQEAHAKEILYPYNLQKGTGNFFITTRTFINKLNKPESSSISTDVAKPIAEKSLGGMVTTTEKKYNLGGIITGLNGPVAVYNNASDRIIIKPGDLANFTFPTLLKPGQPYQVTVDTSLFDSQYCYVSKNGSGVMAQGGVGNIHIQCVATPGFNPFNSVFSSGIDSSRYTISGSVTGLSIGPVVLQNSSGDSITVTTDGSFIFANTFLNQSSYSVTVLSQPSGPAQTCTVANGNGTILNGNITTVSVTCVTNTYTVGGTVSGLSGSLVLQNNSDETITLNIDGSFTFATGGIENQTYQVEVFSNPESQSCSVVNGVGTYETANITNVVVTCLTIPTISLSDSTKTYGDSSFSVLATSNSGGSITYDSSNTSVATVSGNTITIVGAGSSTITATQSADSGYTSTSTTALLTVNKAVPVIDSVSDISIDSSDFLGFCFVDPSALIHPCDSNPFYTLYFPTSTSNALYSTLASTNISIMDALLSRVIYVGHPVLGDNFNNIFLWNIVPPIVPQSTSTLMTLTQGANTNYSTGTINFTLTINPVSSDPDTEVRCFNSGILIASTLGYECICHPEYTGDYCDVLSSP